MFSVSQLLYKYILQKNCTADIILEERGSYRFWVCRKPKCAETTQATSIAKKRSQLFEDGSLTDNYCVTIRQLSGLRLSRCDFWNNFISLMRNWNFWNSETFKIWSWQCFFLQHYNFIYSFYKLLNYYYVE